MHFFTDPFMFSADTGRAKIRFHNMNGSQQNIDQWFMGVTGEFTNISAIESKSISIYPNPTDGWICIDQTVDKIEVFSTFGELVKIKENMDGYLDLSNLSSGMYFLKLHVKDKTTCVKILKKR